MLCQKLFGLDFNFEGKKSLQKETVVSTRDIHWMSLALEQAHRAWQSDEVPIGAVMVYQDQAIAFGYNNRVGSSKPTGHAEINCMEEAGRYLQNWQLNECDLYVSLEPCVMCMGAAVNARLRKLYFGAYDQKGGSISNHLFHPTEHQLNHRVEIYGGILEAECSQILKDFFQAKRSQKQKK